MSTETRTAAITSAIEHMKKAEAELALARDQIQSHPDLSDMWRKLSWAGEAIADVRTAAARIKAPAKPAAKKAAKKAPKPNKQPTPKPSPADVKQGNAAAPEASEAPGVAATGEVVVQEATPQTVGEKIPNAAEHRAKLLAHAASDILQAGALLEGAIKKLKQAGFPVDYPNAAHHFEWLVQFGGIIETEAEQATAAAKQ